MPGFGFGLGLGFTRSSGTRKQERKMNDYAFVDGAPFRSLVESARAYFDIPQTDVFDYGRFFSKQHKANRTFLYDSYPAQKRNQDVIDHQRAVEETQIAFDQINSFPTIHVKTGHTKFSQSRGQQQKGVDILLAIDAYRHAINGLDHVQLWANDGDFFPVLEALQNTPTRSVLVCERRKTPGYLIQLADFVRYVNELDLVDFFGEGSKYSRLNAGISYLAEVGQPEKTGWERVNEYVFPNRTFIAYRIKDSERLKFVEKGKTYTIDALEPRTFLKFVEREHGLFQT